MARSLWIPDTYSYTHAPTQQGNTTGAVNTTVLLELGKQLIFKHFALVVMELSWKPEFKDKISKDLFSSSFGGFFGASVSLRKQGKMKMVHHDQYILILLSKCRKSIGKISRGCVLTMLVSGALVGLSGLLLFRDQHFLVVCCSASSCMCGQFKHSLIKCSVCSTPK